MEETTKGVKTLATGVAGGVAQVQQALIDGSGGAAEQAATAAPAGGRKMPPGEPGVGVVARARRRQSRQRPAHLSVLRATCPLLSHSPITMSCALACRNHSTCVVRVWREPDASAAQRPAGAAAAAAAAMRSGTPLCPTWALSSVAQCPTTTPS